MDVRVNLLGRPAVVRAGAPVSAPRGRKAWALLAYVALAERPVSRRRLAGLLCGEADDPMGALRWNLAEARRALGGGELLQGDPIEVGGDVRASTDVAVLVHGSWSDALALDGLGHDLLEGIELPASPAFDAWLLGQRRHVRALSASVLLEAGLALIAGLQPARAVDVAVRLVELDPYDENAHTLLVRSLAASGDHAAARERVRTCTELFRRELGVEPTAGLRLAADVATGTFTVAPAGGRAAIRAQLEAGEAAITAGAVEAGLQCLRRAVAESESETDTAGARDLHARALLSLGSALVHAVRGRDLEGAAALHRAIALGEDDGDDAVTAAACRTLGFVEVQQGRHERAVGWLDRAERLAGGDGGEQARISGIRGMALSDAARYPEAVAALTTSVTFAQRAGAARQEAWSLSILARAHLLRGELGLAATAVAASLAVVRTENWAAFLPWPEAIAAEIDLAEGRTDVAADRFDHAFALACQIGDPCWQGMAGRGAALVDFGRNEAGRGFDRLHDARARCSELPDSYQWVIAYVLDALCTAGVREGRPAVTRWVDDLDRLAAATGMREFQARVHVHRSELGAPGALDAARVLADDIDNPRLGLVVDHRR